MMSMKRTGRVFTVLGGVVVLATLVADLVLGGDEGFGAFQFFGIEVGILIFLIGIGLFALDLNGKVSIRERLHALAEQIIVWPNVVWVTLAFLILYIPFFLFPLFFSQTQIHYFTKYIPNAYITHVGFDIEAIISRVQAWLATGQSPYADGFIAYPPLAIALFTPLSIIGYPAYFELMTGLTVAAYMMAALVIPLLIIPKRNHALLFLLFVTGLFSYGLQFEQERGQFNLIAFTLCLSAIYLYHYHHKFRYFAYLLFSLSVQLKVYPIMFVAMFIEEWRDWKKHLRRLLGLGVVNFSLLFVLGYKFYGDFVKAITAYQFDYLSSRYENLSIKAYSYYLSTTLFGAETMTKAPAWFEILFLALVVLAFLVVILAAWKRRVRGLNPSLLLVCTLAALLIPSVSNDYKLSILIVPMTLFLCRKTAVFGKSKKIVHIFLILLTSLAYWSTLYPATVKPDFLDRNFPALTLILVSATALSSLAPYMDENVP
ncbi:MAG: glycosyltransferase family 87 protein [Chloroflexota bacterium]